MPGQELDLNDPATKAKYLTGHTFVSIMALQDPLRKEVPKARHSPTATQRPRRALVCAARTHLNAMGESRAAVRTELESSLLATWRGGLNYL